MFRQAWLIAVVGAFLIGCAFLLVVGCSGGTGSQSAGTQKSGESQSAETASERTDSQESESTVAGSQQSGSRESESTHEVTEHGESQANEECETTDEVAEHGGSIEPIPGYGGFLLRVDGIVYDTPFEGAVNQMTYETTTSKVVGRRLDDEDLGSLFAEVTHKVTHEVTKESTDLTTTYSATPNEVPVYAVKGYDPSFRLAACMDDRLIMFEALYNPTANEATDVLDVGGKVSSIDITSRGAAKDLDLVFGTIEDPEKVGRVVQGLIDAPLEQTSIVELSTGTSSSGGGERSTPISGFDDYLIVFHLEDGTAVARDYWVANGRLSNVAYGADLDRRSGIVTPQAFRVAVEEATTPWRENEKHIPSNLTEAGKRRQKLKCGDTQTTKEARTVNGGGVVYTTNDVYPGGPWGGVLRGTEEDDSWLGGDGGEDEVYGLGGNDTIEGGACDDKLYGGPGDDGSTTPSSPPIAGDMGDDVLYGGPGGDRMVGEEGDDVLHGGPGNDELSEGGSDRELEISSGKDIFYGEDGNDVIFATDGQRDELYCGKGKDDYYADKIDSVASSCEVKQQPGIAIP